MNVTVKTTLASVKTHRKLRYTIEQVVKDMQVICYYGSLLAQSVIHHCIYHHLELPTLNQTFFYRCFSIFTSSRQKNPLISTVYNLHFKECLTAHSPKYLTQIINEAARQYLTVVTNHIALNFHQRMLKFWKRKLMNCKFTGNNKYRLLKLLQTATLEKQEPGGLENDLNSFDVLSSKLQEELRDQIIEWRTKYKELLPCVWPSDIQHQTSNLNQFLGWILEMYPENMSELLPKGLPKRLPKGTKGLYRQFSLLPIPRGKVNHITITTTTLYNLLQKSLPKESKEASLPSWPQFRKKKDIWWNKLFPGLQKLKSKSKTFGYYMKTDGISCSVVFKQTSKKKNKKENECLPKIKPTTRLVGIDPNRRDFFVAALKENEDYYELKCSNQEWQALQGTKNASNKTKYHQQKYKVRRNLQRKLSGKVKDYELWKEYLEYVLTHSLDWFKGYSGKQVRRRAFAQYRRKQKALDTLCKRITEGNKDTIVGFGNGGNVSRGFGYAPTCSKALRERLRQHCEVVDIDEYKTSKICNHCHKELGEYKRTSRGIYGIRICRNQDCRIVWNRDFNAALNMRQLLLCKLMGQERPVALRRKS